MAAHRLWRVFVETADGSGTSISIQHLEMYESAFGENQCIGGAAFASSEVAGHTADEAFNHTFRDGGGGNDLWAGTSNTNEWLAYDFGLGNAKDIVAIGIVVRNGSLDQSPNDFRVEWSDDGITWTELFSVADQTAWVTNEYRRFIDPDFDPTGGMGAGSEHGSHDFWRLFVCRAVSDDAPAIGEVEMRASSGGGDQCTGGTPSASSIFSGSFPASKAFDDNTASGLWSAANNSWHAWLKYAFASAVEVFEVAITSRPDGFPLTAPRNILVQWSDDDSNWTTAWSINGQTAWGAPETRVFTDPESFTLGSNPAGGSATDLRVSQVRVEALLAESQGQFTALRVSQVRIEALEIINLQSAVIYADSAVDADVLAWETYLEDSLGYDVEVRDDADLATDVDLDSFSLLIVMSSAVGIGSTARSQAEAFGVPLLIIPLTVAFSEGEGKTTAATEGDLTGTWEYVDDTPGQTAIEVVDNSHFITSLFGLGSVTINSAADLAMAVDDGQSVVGDVLAEADPAHANIVAGQAAVIAVEIGTDDLTGPDSTTVRIAILGQPFDPSTLTADGETLIERTLQWVRGAQPNKPLIQSVTGDTQLTITTAPYQHPLGVAHAYSIYLIVEDGGDPDVETDVVHYSGPQTEALTQYTAPPGSTENGVAYDIYVDHYDLNDVSARSDKFDYTTTALSKAGGLLVEFLESDGSTVVESFKMLTTSETYVELVLEALVRPAGAEFLRVTPYKEGTDAKAGFARNPAVNKGSRVGGYNPKAYFPELDDYHDHGLVSVSSEIDWSKGRTQRVEVDQNDTLSFINPPIGAIVGLLIVQDSTGGWTLGLPTEVIGEPTLSTGADAIDFLELLVVAQNTVLVTGEKLSIA